MSKTIKCKACDGRGDLEYTCTNCDGTGWDEDYDARCEECDGTGVASDECNACSGTGEVGA